MLTLAPFKRLLAQLQEIEHKLNRIESNQPSVRICQAVHVLNKGNIYIQLAFRNNSVPTNKVTVGNIKNFV